MGLKGFKIIEVRKGIWVYGYMGIWVYGYMVSYGYMGIGVRVIGCYGFKRAKQRSCRVCRRVGILTNTKYVPSDNRSVLNLE